MEWCDAKQDAWFDLAPDRAAMVTGQVINIKPTEPT